MARSDRLFAESMHMVLRDAERHRQDSSYRPNYYHPRRSVQEIQTLGELFEFLISESDLPVITPGKAGTVNRRDLNNASMGDGTGKPIRVIDNGRVKVYVGIGWIEEREARPADTCLYPVVVD